MRAPNRSAMRTLLAASTSLLLASNALAGGQEAKLFDPTGDSDDRYGSAVAIDGSTAVVGAPRHAEGGVDSGAAYVYVASGSSWSLEQTLLPSDPSPNQWFGGSVAIDGDTIVVGARHDGEAGFNAGAAYVFTRSGSTWTQEEKLLAANTLDFDWFGQSVAIEGDRALVGAPIKNVVAFGSGAAYSFVRTAGMWSQEAQLAPNDPAGDDFFGWSVDLSGDRAAVGSKFEDAGGAEAGAVYVYLRTGSIWSQEAKLVASDAGADDQLGSSVAIDGTTLVTGSIQDDDNGAEAGAAYVFTRTGTSWSESAKLLASDGGPGDLFGNSIDVLGAALVVGAFHPDELGTHTGAAYVFTSNGATWTEQAKLVGGDSQVDDWLGSSVSISGERVVAGASEHADVGAAYVFRYADAFAAYCLGDGSGTPCPCVNESAPGAGQGCANSTGMGGVLAGSGSPSVSADDLAFGASNLVPGQPALLFAGINAVNGGQGQPFGDGLRCAGGGVVRLGVRTPDAQGEASWGPGLGAAGGWSAGDTRRFQCWYRDPQGGPCGTNFNLSNGVEVLFDA